MAETYVYDGWTINKTHISYYAFAGDSTRFNEVPDFICENAVTLLKTEMDSIKLGVYESADRTNKTLNLAIEYFTICEMKSSGSISETTGDITRESIGDKSVMYGSEMRSNVSKIPIPHQSCDKAIYLVKQYFKERKLLSSSIQISIKNYRSETFGGIYNKYTDNYKYGEPE